MYIRKKLCKYRRHTQQKSWKEGNKLLKQRSNGTKVINENKPSTEQALPALAATSGFYLHQWPSAPRNVQGKCQQNLTEVLRMTSKEVVVVRKIATLKWNWWPFKGRSLWNPYFPSWQQSANNSDTESYRAATTQVEAGMSEDILGIRVWWCLERNLERKIKC